MSHLKIDTQDGRRDFAPGEAVPLACAWQLDKPPASVEVRLVWYTRGKGDQDVSVVEAIRYDEPGAMGMKRPAFTLPEGPYSFSGKLISLIWAVELIAEPSGESHRVDLVVAPEGEEVQLVK
jgi:hypothetical protein